MTWTVNVSGHFEDRSKEKEIADLVRDDVKAIVEKVRDYGLSTANFYGNEYQENFLVETASS